MTLTTNDLIAALRLRYDYYSAQTILESALTSAGLAPKAAYDAAEIAAFRAALSRVGDRLAAVDARLDALAGSPALAANAAAANAAVPAAEAPVAEAPAAEPVAKAAAPAAVEPVAEAPAAEPVAKAAAVAKEVAADPVAKEVAADPVKAATPAAVEPVATATPAVRATVEPVATPAAAVATSATIEIVITLTGVPIDEDEQVLVCGGLPELGDWDVTRARPMVREGDRWLATLELAADTEAPFKFVRCAADGSATWEAGANRSLVAVPSIVTSWQ